TINTVTLSYTPIDQLPDSIELRSWNVYIDPKSGQVKQIFIKKELHSGERVLTQQFTWYVGKDAEIVNILEKSDGTSELLSQEKFIWHF
ncbi:MAG TPA: hypothetical protein VN922_11800, partial [Bacteroidia bacterium]|nr:hypothetical protein [Bacteroidia bacterium]